MMQNTDLKSLRADCLRPKHRYSLLSAVLIVLTASIANGQSAITLDYCIQSAYRNFDFLGQRDIAAEITQNNVTRIERGYLPSLEFNAISTYQNSQITIPLAIPIPGLTLPSAPLNLNSALFTLRQWIYDGSAIHHNSLVEQASGNVALLEVESQKLDLKTRVIQRFFSVLLTDKQIENLLLRDRVLTDKLAEVIVAVNSNVMLASERDLLQAEILSLRAAISESKYARSEQIVALGELMGEKLSADAVFELPSAALDKNASIEERPDIKLVDGQMELMETRKGSISSIYLPRVGLFADLGLGYPGYNIFDKNVVVMAKVGVTLSWKIFDWNQGALQKQSIDLNKKSLTIQRRRIQTQANVVAESFLNGMARAEELMKSDQELLLLYSSVTNVYAVKMMSGTITSAEYVAQLTKQEQARVNSELHKLQYLVAVMNYNSAMGR
ncbi:MAG: TolC family protein [Ignavibacteria bacterium]|nr:TolC family protein [Ignavibacteria bacterium]